MQKNSQSESQREGQIDPAITLQFLKSAVYYFLTDRDNAKGHLRAIMSILGFNDAEKGHILSTVKFSPWSNVEQFVFKFQNLRQF